MNEILSKDDSKYLKTALKLLRQGKSMLRKISEETDIDTVKNVTMSMANEIDNVMQKSGSIEDYIATGKYVQLMINFEK